MNTELIADPIVQQENKKELIVEQIPEAKSECAVPGEDQDSHSVQSADDAKPPTMDDVQSKETHGQDLDGDVSTKDDKQNSKTEETDEDNKAQDEHNNSSSSSSSISGELAVSENAPTSPLSENPIEVVGQEPALDVTAQPSDQISSAAPADGDEDKNMEDEATKSKRSAEVRFLSSSFS
jgi:hypothetical protein